MGSRRYCCIPGCSNNSSTGYINGQKITLHRFPAGQARQHIRHQWISVVKNVRANLIVNESTRICSIHFEGGFTPYAIPSIFPSKPKEYANRKLYTDKGGRERGKRWKSWTSSTDDENEQVDSSAETDNDTSDIHMCVTHSFDVGEINKRLGGQDGTVYLYNAYESDEDEVETDFTVEKHNSDFTYHDHLYSQSLPQDEVTSDGFNIVMSSGVDTVESIDNSEMSAVGTIGNGNMVNNRDTFMVVDIDIAVGSEEVTFGTKDVAVGSDTAFEFNEVVNGISITSHVYEEWQAFENNTLNSSNNLNIPAGSNVEYDFNFAGRNNEDGCNLVEIPSFTAMKDYLKNNLFSSWKLSDMEEIIQIYELYEQNFSLSVKQVVIIDQNFYAKILVHGKEISKENPVWHGLPEQFYVVDDIFSLLRRIQSFSVCFGNPDEDFFELVAVGENLLDGFTSEVRGYREGDFCAVKGNCVYHSSIRSIKCEMLIQGRRCKDCLKIRNILIRRQERRDERMLMPERNYLTSHTKHKHMDREQLLTKIQQQRDEIFLLASELEKQKRKNQKRNNENFD